MKRFISSILSLAMPLIVWGQDSMYSVQTHFSSAINADRSYSIIVPEGANEAEQPVEYPVLYILHGAYDNHLVYLERTKIAEMAKRYEMIFVFPDGDEFGWYADSPLLPESQIESYIIKDLIPYVDEHYPTNGARSVMGLSMGGNGAVMLTARHPGTFQSASGMSSIFDLTIHPNKWSIAEKLGPVEENMELWKSYSSLYLIDSLKEQNIPIMFDSGVLDTKTEAITRLREFHAALTEAGVPHLSREFPGTHSWDYWRDHIMEHVDFHQAVLIDQTPGYETKMRRHYYERMNGFIQDNMALTLNPMPKDKPTLLLLGSSSSESLGDELFPDFHVINRGIAGDTLGAIEGGILARMELSAFDFDSDIILFKQGRNDLGDWARTGSPSLLEIHQAYCEVVEQILERRPNATLILQKCAPVGGRYAFLKDALEDFNQGVEEIAEYYGLQVIDPYTPFLNENGEFKEEYTRDGLHFNDAGRAIWADMINEVLEKNS